MLQKGAIGSSLSGGNWVLEVALWFGRVRPEPGTKGLEILAAEGQIILDLSPKQLSQISGHIWIVPTAPMAVYKCHRLQVCHFFDDWKKR